MDNDDEKIAGDRERASERETEREKRQENGTHKNSKRIQFQYHVCRSHKSIWRYYYYCCVSYLLKLLSHSFNPCKHDIVIDSRYLVNTEIYENIFLWARLLIKQGVCRLSSPSLGTFERCAQRCCFRFTVFAMEILINVPFICQLELMPSRLRTKASLRINMYELFDQIQICPIVHP